MTMHGVCFEKEVPTVGHFALSYLRVPEDIAVIHEWVNRDYATYWGMQNKSRKEVEEAYREILAIPDSCVCLGFHNSKAAFLLECYHPRQDVIKDYYEVQPGDRGMHILVAPADRPIANFTWQVFTIVMDFMFRDETVERIVVEPDVRNEKIHRLNRRAGFVYQEVVQLPKKTAYLAFCTRGQYQAALTRDSQTQERFPASYDAGGVAHLTPGIWSTVNRLHLRKAISEFSHECILKPRLEGQEGEWGHYVLQADHADIRYRFRAQLLSLDHWHIDGASIEKFVAKKRVPLDALSFILEFQQTLGIQPNLLPTYLEEIASTLYGRAYKQAYHRLSAAELAFAEFQDVESGMMEGHPAFVANNGRIGFDLADYRNYAPEVGSDVRLGWLAADKSRATFASVGEWEYDDFIREELSETAITMFHLVLRTLGLEPERYLFLPVHPWQWANKLASLFSADLALRNLVYLGQSPDVYRAQQSIRTFFNLTHPERHYVKTALSILNMGFMRGLSAKYMENTPAINEWVDALINDDAYLRENGFSILREVASVGYRQPHFESAVTGDSPYKKMLAALWRESPIPPLLEEERLMTMAALLHRDRAGAALLPALIHSAGIEPEEWLRQYFRCYLAPLLHCFYRHDLVFMPHGENVILVLRDHIPVRVLVKDIAEESAILDPDRRVPEKAQRLAVSVPEDLKILSIFTDVFDGFLRFLAEVVWENGLCSETCFWSLVAGCVRDYQDSHPELSEKFHRYDLFALEFPRSCLNRLQLANNQQMIDLADPAKNLQFAGKLSNPIAPFRSKARKPEIRTKVVTEARHSSQSVF